ncbi:MAG: TIGR04141 family sporadically distributed protein [Agriterribacter sp.]
MIKSNKIPVTIYEIEREQFEKLDIPDTVGEIERQLNTDGIKLNTIDLNQNFDNHYVSLFTISKHYPPTWLKFLQPVISIGSQILTASNRVFSFIGFIGFGERLYAIAGGYGSFEIERFTKSSFGLDIIVRLFEKDSRVIKAIQQRGVTGVVLGQSRHYRGDQRFADENQFGQIFKEVQTELDKTHLVKSFGFTPQELRKESSGCLAKSSFKINKAITFEKLLQLVQKIDTILMKTPNFQLNKAVHLKGQRFENLLRNLDQALVKQIYDDYKSGQIPDFEICHQQFERYLKAESYAIELNQNEILEYDDRPTWSDIISKIKEKRSLLDEDEYQLNRSVLLQKLYSRDSEGSVITRDSVLNHLNGELIHLGKSYFRIDKGWYQIEESFLEDLNNQCVAMFAECWEESLITNRFDIQKDEKVFNQSYLGKPGWIVLDTVTPENIECCDLLYHDSNQIYLVHVKKGFNNTMRDLAAQISIAAKRIQETMVSDFEYIKQLEAYAKQPFDQDTLRKAISKQPFPAQGLLGLFSQVARPKLTFCLAFVDTSNSGRSLKSDIKSFHSNIAKYSLVELYQQLRFWNIDFKVIQIPR